MRSVSRTKAMPVNCINLLAWRGTKRQIAAVCGAVLALVVLAVDLPVVDHQHNTPGLYDEDCPLVRLAAGVPRVPQPHAVDAPRPLTAPDAPLLTAAVPPATLRAPSSAPRAPPAVV